MAQACRLHLGTNLGRHGSVLLLAVVSAAKFSLVQLLRTTFLARTTLWTKAVGASKFVPQDCARGHTGYKFCFYIRCIFLGMHRPWRSGHQCTRRLVQTRSQALWKIKMATASTSGRYFLTLWICGLQPWNQNWCVICATLQEALRRLNDDPNQWTDVKKLYLNQHWKSVFYIWAASR